MSWATFKCSDLDSNRAQEQSQPGVESKLDSVKEGNQRTNVGTLNQNDDGVSQALPDWFAKLPSKIEFPNLYTLLKEQVQNLRSKIHELRVTDKDGRPIPVPENILRDFLIVMFEYYKHNPRTPRGDLISAQEVLTSLSRINPNKQVISLKEDDFSNRGFTHVSLYSLLETIGNSFGANGFTKLQASCRFLLDQSPRVVFFDLLPQRTENGQLDGEIWDLETPEDLFRVLALRSREIANPDKVESILRLHAAFASVGNATFFL